MANTMNMRQVTAVMANMINRRFNVFVMITAPVYIDIPF